jgi:hypothetical protein
MQYISEKVVLICIFLWQNIFYTLSISCSRCTKGYWKHIVEGYYYLYSLLGIRWHLFFRLHSWMTLRFINFHLLTKILRVVSHLCILLTLLLSINFYPCNITLVRLNAWWSQNITVPYMLKYNHYWRNYWLTNDYWFFSFCESFNSIYN